MENFSELHLRGGLTRDRLLEFAVATKGLHGAIENIDEHTMGAGDDTALFVPEQRLFGVFDGAGGATDVGKPWIASRTAARAAVDFWSLQDLEKRPTADSQLVYETELMQDAMKFIRKRVNADTEAGLTTVAMTKFVKHGKRIVGFVYANAGDSSVLLYPDQNAQYRDEELKIVAGEQINAEQYCPSNIVGRIPERVAELVTDQDQVGFQTLPNSETYILLATDGVNGSWQRTAELTDDDFRLALEYEPLIKAALKKDSVRLDLQKAATKHNFSLQAFDWEQWYEYIKPVLTNRSLTQVREPSIQEVIESILDPRIVNPTVQDGRRDDKSAVLIKPSSY